MLSELLSFLKHPAGMKSPPIRLCFDLKTSGPTRQDLTGAELHVLNPPLVNMQLFTVCCQSWRALRGILRLDDSQVFSVWWRKDSVKQEHNSVEILQ